MVVALAGDRARSRRTGLWLFALALVVYLFTAGGSLTSTDAVVTFDVTERIVSHGTVAMSGNLLGMESQRGLDGRYYSPFGIGQSVFNIPFYLASRAVVSLTGFQAGKPDTVPKAAVALSQTLVAALIVLVTFHLACAVTGDATSSAFAALTLAFGSVLWPYARFGFNQPLACATLVAAVYCAYVGVQRARSRDLALSGLWIGASLITRHEMALAAAPLTLWILMAGDVAVPTRIRRVLTFLPGVIIGVVAWLAYNAVRFGNPLDTGLLRDPIPAFGSPIIEGLRGLLFSPSASLFLYSPMVLFGLIGLGMLARRQRPAALLFGGLTLLFILFYALLGNWIGGRAYGSRYLVVILPYAAVGWAAWLSVLDPRRRRLGFAAVLLAGALLQMPGVLVDYAKVGQSAAVATGTFTTAQRQWEWRASSLILNTRALIAAVPANLSYILGRREPPAVRPAIGDDDRSFSQQLAFSLDFWWLYLFYMHALSRAGVLIVVLVAAVAITVCWRGLSQSLLLTRP